MITGAIQLRTEFLFFGENKELYTLVARSGNENQMKEKLRKVLAVWFFNRFLSDLKKENNLRWRNGVYSLYRDKFYFCNAMKVNWNDYRLISPVKGNANDMLREFDLITKNIPRGIFISDDYKNRIVKADYQTIL